MNKEFWEMLERIVRKSKLIIDRPKGSHHPRYREVIYQVDYGYLENTTSMDNGGIDVWRGTLNDDEIKGIIITVDEKKNDSEIKILIGCSEEEIQKVLSFHNEHLMKEILIRNETRDN